MCIRDSGKGALGIQGNNARLKLINNKYYLLHEGSLDVFDESGKILSSSNQSGIKKTFTYDQVSGQLIMVSDDFGRSIYFEFDGNKRISRVTSSFGDAVGSVSYTHLDVYKRQLLHNRAS